MNREGVIRMAREACAPEWWDEGTGFHMGLDLARFAALVAAAEREACAQVCEQSDRYRGAYFAQKIRER